MPFEEDENDTSIWFLDHSYLETMFRMFKKVNGEMRDARARWRPWGRGTRPLRQAATHQRCTAFRAFVVRIGLLTLEPY